MGYTLYWVKWATTSGEINPEVAPAPLIMPNIVDAKFGAKSYGFCIFVMEFDPFNVIANVINKIQ